MARKLSDQTRQDAWAWKDITTKFTVQKGLYRFETEDNVFLYNKACPQFLIYGKASDIDALLSFEKLDDTLVVEYNNAYHGIENSLDGCSIVSFDKIRDSIGKSLWFSHFTLKGEHITILAEFWTKEPIRVISSRIPKSDEEWR
jgi:hypothetical protein